MNTFSQKNSVLVMDNTQIHHDEYLVNLVESVGCKIIYFPPYPPDFNPIEHMVFSTNTPETFQVLYNPSCRSLVDSELSLLSKKVNLFATVLIVASVGMRVTGRKSCYPILQTARQSTSRKIPRRTISPTPSSRPRRPRRQQQ